MNQVSERFVIAIDRAPSGRTSGSDFGLALPRRCALVDHVKPRGSRPGLSIYSDRRDAWNIHALAPGRIRRWEHGMGEGETGSPVSVMATADDIVIDCDELGQTVVYVFQASLGSVVITNDLAIACSLQPGEVYLDVDAVVQQALFGWPLAPRSYIRNVRRMGARLPRVSIRVVHGELVMSSNRRARTLGVPAGIRLDQMVEQSFRDVATPEPGAVLLSGGVDSAVVAAESVRARRERGFPDPVAITFGDRGSPEFSRAEAIAQHLSIRWVQAVPAADRCWDGLIDAVVATHEPRVSPGIASGAAHAAQLAGVVYSGECADQVFGGSWRQAQAGRFLASLIRRARYMVATRLPGEDPASGELLELLRWLCEPVGESERSRRMYALELDFMLPYRSLTTLPLHLSRVGCRPVLPFLTSDLVATIGTNPAGRLRPLGTKAVLANMLTASFPPGLVGQIQTAAKRSPMDATRRTMSELESMAASLVPTWWVASHPLGQMFLRIKETFGALQVLTFDVFVRVFCLGRGRAEDVRLESLYERGPGDLYEAYNQAIGDRNLLARPLDAHELLNNMDLPWPLESER